MWPTHGAREAKSDTANPDGREARGRQMMLCHRVRQWPTPKASAAGPDFAKMDRSATVISLQTAVAMFPTPKSRDCKGQSQCGIHAPGDALPNMDRGDGTVIGGSLNPTWVEWLMGWPLGWTDLSASATGRFQQWQRQHGRY